MLKKYQMGFDPRGLFLFLIIMIPNFIWFLRPAPDDILRAESVTPALDTVSSVCQVLMIGALCAVRSRRRCKCAVMLFSACAVCCLFYFAGWGLYYAGIADAAVVLALTLFGGLPFILFAAGAGNLIALVLAVLFTACHVMHAAVNFII